MTYQNISAEISEETVTQLIQHVKGIEQHLPFVINLTPDEIRSLPKMGDKSVSSCKFCVSCRLFMPGRAYVDLDKESRIENKNW